MLISLLDLPNRLFIFVRLSISFRSWKICCVQSMCSVCSWAGGEGWQLQWSWWQNGFQVWTTFKAGSTSTITICLYPFRVNSFYLYTICVAPWITVKKHWWMDDLANWGSAFPHRIVDIFCKKNTWVDMCIDSQLNSCGRLLYWWPIFLPLRCFVLVSLNVLNSNTLMDEQPQGDSEIITCRGTLIPFSLCRRLWSLWWSCHHLMLVGLVNLNFSHSILASYITNSDLSCPVHPFCFIYWIGHEHSLCMCLTICSSICCNVMAGSDVLVFRVYEYAFGRLQICGQRSVDLANNVWLVKEVFRLVRRTVSCCTILLCRSLVQWCISTVQQTRMAKLATSRLLLKVLQDNVPTSIILTKLLLKSSRALSLSFCQ